MLELGPESKDNSVYGPCLKVILVINAIHFQRYNLDLVLVVNNINI